MKCFKFGSQVAAIGLVLTVGVSSAWAKSWYVQAKSNPHSAGNGSLFRPFTSLAEVEAASGPGDNILVLPSRYVLDGGIQLKNGQRLLGLGPDVTGNCSSPAHARISNSTSAHLEGDAVRLANDNTVANIHISGTWRSGILGVNVDNAEIKNNLITENMKQHTLQTLQEDFVIFQAQRNHYGAITLFACGATAPNECTDEDPSTAGLASASAVIKGNEIYDVNVEGIVILNDAGVITHYDIKDTKVDGVSMGFGGFRSTDLVAPLVPEVVRSRAFTIIVGNGAHANVDIKDFYATHLGPEGDFATDGIVLVNFGNGGIVTGDIKDITILNPDFTGEIVNGDSLELTSFGSNGIFDVRVKDAVMKDSVSTLVKLLEVGPVNGNSFYFDIKDSLLSNANPRALVPEARGALVYLKIPAPGAVATDTVDVAVRNVTMTGHLRGLLVQNLNSVHMNNLSVLVEKSTFANHPNEGVRYFNQNGVIDNVTIDLGGGPLGSRGRNSFVNNGVPADLAAVNLNFAGPVTQVHASKNYWGGGAPVTGTGANLFSTGPVAFIVNSFLSSDPND